jgi:NADH:ubiquinone oxidoreductase subunit 6 (subunit J)
MRYLAFPALILVVGVSYLLLTGEPAGSALLLIFAGAMGVFTWVLIPTADNVGPTAPVDPDFEPPPR